MSDTKQIQEKLDAFTAPFQSVVLSTLTSDQQPFASYVPFVRYDHHYYLILSKAAKHYLNMLSHPDISIMFIEDEKDAANVFFRKRLSYLVHTTFDVDAETKDAFVHKFGEFVNRLFLMDFVMARCDIISGHFIIGPGQAYQINDQEQIVSQMTGNNQSGHQSK